MKKTVRRIGRGFRRLARVVFRAVSFAVLLTVFAVATAALVAQYIVSPDALKVIITAQLQDAFHRPVQIQDVKFNAYQGIRVQGLKVLESADFSGGEFLTSDYLLAKYKWSALLHKRLEFERIQLTAPRIQLVRATDGRWNWQDILASLAPRRSDRDRSKLTLPVNLFAHVISIEHGVVTI